MSFNCHPKDFLGDLAKEVQAEGGFGRRRVFVGRFVSAIEFGPQ
jgi:hypothetical protein